MFCCAQKVYEFGPVNQNNSLNFLDLFCADRRRGGSKYTTTIKIDDLLEVMNILEMNGYLPSRNKSV